MYSINRVVADRGPRLWASANGDPFRGSSVLCLVPWEGRQIDQFGRTAAIHSCEWNDNAMVDKNSLYPDESYRSG